MKRCIPTEGKQIAAFSTAKSFSDIPCTITYKTTRVYGKWYTSLLLPLLGAIYRLLLSLSGQSCIFIIFPRVRLDGAHATPRRIIPEHRNPATTTEILDDLTLLPLHGPRVPLGTYLFM